RAPVRPQEQPPTWGPVSIESCAQLLAVAAPLACCLGQTIVLGAMRLKLRPLRRTRCTESKSLDHEGVVVLLLALFVGPVVGPHAGCNHELIAFAGILRESFAQCSEGHEPQARDYFAR